MNRLQVNPATATPAQLAEWLIADASDGAIHYWAEQYLFSLGEDEMRQMVRDAMPEDSTGECEICHNVCDSTTASGICGNCFYPEDNA